MYDSYVVTADVAAEGRDGEEVTELREYAGWAKPKNFGAPGRVSGHNSGDTPWLYPKGAKRPSEPVELVYVAHWEEWEDALLPPSTERSHS